MKKLLLFIIFSVLLCTSIFAQTGGKALCPELSISGPAGIVQSGETANYSADIDLKGEKFNIEYVWSVSSGKIIGGQGTRLIEVEQPN